jgi:hypothetical protein
MLTRTLFLGNTEETWRHTQLMDGPTQQEDSLFLKMPTPKKIFLIRMSMKKFGDS